MANTSLPKDESSASIQNTTNDDEKELPAYEKSLLQKIVRTGLVTSKHDIEVQRRDPKSPLYSVKSFELLKLYDILFSFKFYAVIICIFIVFI